MIKLSLRVDLDLLPFIQGLDGKIYKKLYLGENTALGVFSEMELLNSPIYKYCMPD